MKETVARRQHQLKIMVIQLDLVVQVCMYYQGLFVNNDSDTLMDIFVAHVRRAWQKKQMRIISPDGK
jgi:hypothetical protein